MCGFIGYINGTNVIDHHQTIENMMNTIIHRGPDSGGIHSDDKVTLGFRRLSIIDLSDVANQPLYSADGNIVLVFNGEIFNFQELRADLIEKGHNFKTHSDSEVIIYGYVEYGVEFVKKLRGMFAFCIWDKKNDLQFIARDGFGIKPLYYTENTTDGTFIFGSEIKSFLPHPSFIKELNKNALRPYLTFQYSSMDETFFKGVYKLQPAHYMLIQNGQKQIVQYWDKKFHAKEAPIEKYVEDIRTTVKESVDAHQISDVKVGSFLSGGIDSSYITSLLRPDKSFSVGFSDYEDMFNETNLAKELSDTLNIQNERKYISADECFEALPKIQWHMDEPQSNPSSVPLYFLSELASKDVTVVLSGEGADEIFGGYSWYQNSGKMQKYEKIPFGIRKALRGIAEALPKNQYSNFLVKGGQTVEERFIGEAVVWDEEDALNVLKPDYKNGPSVKSITKRIYDEVPGDDDVTKMQYLDLNLWMPGDILLKADKMSMAHSIELRVPFLDKEVMELAKNIPSKYRVNDIDTKYVLRQAAHQELPEEWAKRPKLGFPVPIRHWLREEKYYKMVKEMFTTDFANEFFDTKQLVGYLDEHYEDKANRGRYIWTAYVFLVWYKQFFVDM
ncbi:asparagine synthase (glutamine-hydrolyzing) [Lysinibacillus agricola]|uniref:asparagine synthase (glutamine-hydrolyzing) n=1 Tax=Lysinibacillus agricola TaxID=2590012 RepID=A0ABX7APF1_9BACI|nr:MULTISPECIES: asparagine synthase (glutamine-hydrolyzing) [Lysinibacillus]KOS64311.1 asparagine synthase [Lysinibacillus sp. FJAT-14222]QQP11832.1 asparagine synthase (glutamine-hydrolyzing) [Lysinibacillus agricola]